jgi:signal transduction histidine kinase/DNA-binding response OmpR family regulator
MPGTAATSPPTLAAFEGGSVRVLCVGPEPSDVERCRDLLGARFQVDGVVTAAECLTRLAHGRYDVLLLAPHAADMGSLDLLRALQGRRPEVPAVVLAYERSEALVTEALALGAYDCLVERGGDLPRLARVLGNAATSQRLAAAQSAVQATGQVLAGLSAGCKPEELFGRIAQAAREVTGAEGSLLLLLEEGDTLVPRAWSGFGPRALTAIRFPAGTGVWAEVMAARGAVRLDPIAVTEPWSVASVLAEVEAGLAAPITAQGRPRGVLLAAAPPGRQFGPGEEAALRTLADLAAVAVERRALAEELLHSERLSTVGRMVAGVAHELNNPLSVIVGTLDLLRHEAIPERAAQRLEGVSAQAQRAVKIVRTLLALARKRAPQQQEVDLNELLDETLELAAYDLKRAGVRPVERLARDLPPVPGDRDQLQQVFTNLFLNACYALRQAGREGTLTVTTGLEARAGRAVVTVADDGPGIPAEHVPRIFEPFFTTKAEGEGTGLGLAICRRIIEGHGGRIRVASRPGAGATFTIELPATAVTRRAEPAPLAEPPAPITGVSVLLVEDEPLVGDMLEDLLVLEGHEVDRAANGREALARVRSRAYALVVSDVQMPDLSGPSFQQELARVDPALARRIVFVTGDVVNSETRRFLDENQLSYVAKPFAVSEFRSAVRRALGG